MKSGRGIFINERKSVNLGGVLGLGLGQSLLQVGDQVVRVLDADGQADEGVGQADLQAVLHRHAGVGHDGGGAGQGLHSAQGHRQAEHLELGQELAGGLQASLDEDGHHGTGAVGLGLSEGLLGVGGEAGVVDLVDHGVLLQELGDSLGVAYGSVHADVQGLETAQGEVAVEGRGHGASQVLQGAQLGVQCVGVGEHGAHEHVGVAGDVLGHAVHHEVGTHRQGALQVGGHEGAVHAHQEALALGHGGDLADVGGLQQRVGGGLQPDHSGLGGDGGLHLGDVIEVHEGEVDASLGSGDLAEVTGSTAIQIIQSNHVVAGVKQLDHRLGSSQTGGESIAVLGILSSSQGTLEGSSGRVGLAGVEETVSIRRRVLDSRLLARVSLDEGGG